MRSLTTFIIRKNFFGLVVTAIILTRAVASWACMQQGEADVPEPEDAERLMTVWLGAPACYVVDVTGNIEEGWMVACNMTMTRRTPFGILAHVSPDGSVLSTRTFKSRSLELRSIIKLRGGGYLLVGTDSPTYRDIQEADLKQFDMFQHPETGETMRVIRYISSDFVVWKLDSDGETMWRQNYRRYDSDTAADNFLTAAFERPDGELIFVGTTKSKDITSAVRILRTDRNGEPLSETIYTPFENFTCGDAIFTSDGEMLIGGTVNVMRYDSARIVLMKIDADGEMLWSRGYDKHGSEILHSMTRTTDGTIAFTGRSYNDNGNSVAFLKMVDEVGVELWTRRFHVAQFNEVAATAEGGVLVTGRGLVVETDRELNILRQLRAGGLQIQSTATVQLIDESRILLGGFAAPPEGEGDDYRRQQGFLTIIRR